MAPVRTGTLGKQDDQTTGVEDMGDFLVQSCDVRAPVAPHKEGAREPGEPAKDRRALHVALRDKDRGSHCAEDQDIEVTEVIADEQASEGNRSAGVDLQLKNAQDAPAGLLQP